MPQKHEDVLESLLNIFKELADLYDEGKRLPKNLKAVFEAEMATPHMLWLYEQLIQDRHDSFFSYNV